MAPTAQEPGSSATSAAVAIDAGVDPVLGVHLGLAAGLAEAVDAERHGADAERAADERQRVARAVDHRDDGQPALVRARAARSRCDGRWPARRRSGAVRRACQSR